MVRTTMCGGRALSIAVGITMFLLLMAGGAEALSDWNISSQSDINKSFILHHMDAGITSNRDLGIQEKKKLLPVKGIEKAAVKILAKAGWFISDTETGGDCTFIGTWNIISKTCTLTTDLNKTIVIDSDNITLDGNGHTITGSSSGYGIYLPGRSGVTIKNTNVMYFYNGIYLHDSNNNTLSGNNALNNTYGIYLYYSSNNNLFNNTMKENSYNFVVYGWSDSHFNNKIDSSNTVDGKPIYYVINAKNAVYDSSTDAGFFYCISCLNVTIKDIELLKNDVGILFWNTTFSKIQNVTVSNNGDGIVLLESSNNMVIGNNMNLNEHDGIYLEYSYNNTLIGNNANSNNGDGIYLYESGNSTLSGNNASNNSNGIYLDYSSNNTLFDNTMAENSFNFGLYGMSDSDFINLIDSSNTVDGKPIYYIKNANNTVYDYSTNAGILYCISCLNVTIKDIELLKNEVGILFWNTTFSKIQNVTVSNNYYGIELYLSSNNALSGNNASNNYGGIVLWESGNNTLSGNNVNSNNEIGIVVYESGNNTLSNNNALNDNYYGIVLLGSGNNTLSGNNANSDNEVGIVLLESSNNMLSGNNASNNYDGIVLLGSTNNTMDGNIALNNYEGIYLDYSSNNMLFENTMAENSFNFGLSGSSDSDLINQIDSSNTVDGKPIFYVLNAKNTVYDSSTNAGLIYCISCLNVTIKDIELLKNDVGILFWNTTFSKIQNVTVSKNDDGIVLLDSSNNTLSDNNVNSNKYDGIYLYNSSNNTLNDNNPNSNIHNGIHLTHSSNNMLSGNNASYNIEDGISLSYSNSNLIYNNHFNNTNNSGFSGSNINTWNTTLQSGTNIIGGSYLGGNFWANPSGTGFSQTCADANSNEVCDSEYVLDSNNIDYMPLSINLETIFPLPIDPVTGKVNTTITPLSGNVTITIPNGTVAVDETGNSLTNISIDTCFSLSTNATLKLSVDDGVTGNAIKLKPEGARFYPPIQLRFNYSLPLPSGVDENSLTVHYFNTSLNGWEDMYTVEHNIAQHYIIANISHFGTFALIGTKPISGGGASSDGGTYPPDYDTTGTTKTSSPTVTATDTPVTTMAPVTQGTEMPTQTAQPEVTVTRTAASEPTAKSPGFGTIIAVFAIAMVVSLLKNNRNRR